jgi:hypothetical protein
VIHNLQTASIVCQLMECGGLNTLQMINHGTHLMILLEQDLDFIVLLCLDHKLCLEISFRDKLKIATCPLLRLLSLSGSPESRKPL